jgi:hypothetical protein
VTLLPRGVSRGSLCVWTFCRRSRLEIVAPGFNRGFSSPPELQARFSGRQIPRCIPAGTFALAALSPAKAGSQF